MPSARVEIQGYEPFGSLLPGRNYNAGSYRNLFQGQEHDDEIYGSTGTSYAYKYRMHDARVGRFWSIDPLAADYPWNSPYAFSENKVIHAIELEGLEAWEINSEWTESDVTDYRNSVDAQTQKYQEAGTRMTCEDLAANALIDFASKNGLPVSFMNGEGFFDASDKKYQDVETFRHDVLKSTGAVDLMENTTPIAKTDLLPGDMILHYNDEPRIHHTQLVTMTDDEIVQIRQGNFDWGLIRNSADPQAGGGRRYIGSTVQFGLYLKRSGDYYREGERTEGLLNSSTTIGRRWNFDTFNFRKKVVDYLQR